MKGYLKRNKPILVNDPDGRVFIPGAILDIEDASNEQIEEVRIRLKKGDYNHPDNIKSWRKKKSKLDKGVI